MGRLSYRNTLLARNNYFQNKIEQVNANLNTFNEQQTQQNEVANSSWLRHPLDKAGQGLKSFFGLEPVLPEVQNAPKEYNDLRQLQLNKQYTNSPLTRAANVGYAANDIVRNEYDATKDLNPVERVQRNMKLGYEKTGQVAKGAEQFLSGFVDVGKDIYQGSVYAKSSGEQVNKINSLLSQIKSEQDPEKQKQLQENLKQETQKLNDIPVPEMMNQTNAQLIAKAGLASFNTMLTALTFGTGNLLAKGGEKFGGNFLERAVGSLIEKAPVELGADATFKQIITHDIAKVAQNKLARGIVKVIGNKATAESTAIGGAYMAADAVKNGETDPKKIQDAAVKGMAFGWALDRTMTGLIKGASKLVGADTQRLSLQELISATEARSGRPLTDAEKEIAVKAFKTRTGTPQSVAAGLEKVAEENGAFAKPELQQAGEIVPIEKPTKTTVETPSGLSKMDETDFNNNLKSKIEVLPPVKPDETMIIQSGDGKWVDTDVKVALNRGTDANTKVSVVKTADLKLPEDPLKVQRGERLLESQPLQEGGIAKGTPKVEQPTVGKTAKAASDINKKIVQQGFDALPDEELAKYSPFTKKEQIEKIGAMLDDYENAKQIAITGEGVPAGVKKQILFNAVENKAAQEGDVELLRQLAKSPIASELSAHASELGSAAVMHNQNSPVSAMQEVVKAREKYVTKKVGDITKASKKIATEINAEVKKVPHLKQTWSDFVTSITC